MSRYEIKLFGGLEVLRDGEPITHFRTQRAKAIVAYLALFPRQHLRETVCDAIWPDATIDEARSRLRQELSVLRKTLELPGSEGEFLVADRLTLALKPGTFTTDVAAFERALRAGDWHRAGELVTGPLLRDCYDEWALTERNRLDLLIEEVRARQAALPPRSLSERAPISPLPIPLSRFFGRERELRWIRDAVAEGTRLITLTGPGGSGKTSLGVEAARLLTQHTTVFVATSDLDSATDLSERIAQASGALRTPLKDPMELAVEALTGLEHPLLMLDGVEHLLGEGGAETVRTLLVRVPTLSCLITSRRPLELTGEREFPVMPLDVPEVGLGPERLQLYAAVRLFVDRVQAKRPEFALTERNADAVGEICRRLEGLPLGLELAAARCRDLPLETFLERYAQNLVAIEARDRDVAPRHRTLRAAIASSYYDLTPEEQAFFARLSVFCGGWTLAAAEAISLEPSVALDHLTLLRDRSLIVVAEGESEPRWRMLELLRAYATEQVPREQTAALLERHARFFQANAAQYGADPHEAANLRAAIQNALDVLENNELALDLCVRLRDFWMLRGHLREGLAFLDRALSSTTGANALRAEGFRLAGILSRRAGDMEQARQWQETALGLFTEVGDQTGVASVRNTLAVLARVTGNLPEALRQHEEALALRRQIGDSAGIGASLNNLGVVYRAMGECDRSRAHLQESLGFYEPGSVGAGIVQINLGWTALLVHDLVEARREFTVGFGIAQQSHVSAWYPELFEGLGQLTALEGNRERAARLWGAAERERERQGAPLSPEDRREQDERVLPVRAVLGEVAYAKAAQIGRERALEANLAEAQEVCCADVALMLR